MKNVTSGPEEFDKKFQLCEYNILVVNDIGRIDNAFRRNDNNISMGFNNISPNKKDFIKIYNKIRRYECDISGIENDIRRIDNDISRIDNDISSVVKSEKFHNRLSVYNRRGF